MDQKDSQQENSPKQKRRNRLGKRQRDRMKKKKEHAQASKQAEAQPITTVTQVADRYLYLRDDLTGITTPRGGFIRAGVNGRVSANDLSESGADIQWLIQSGMIGEDTQPMRPLTGLTN